MRKILFRGKTIENGEWVYGDLTQNPRPAIFENRGHRGENDVVSETVGQFTGLTDKNGKKIFEGDILCQEYTQQRISDDKIQTNKNAAVVAFGAYTPDDYDDRNSYSWLMDGMPISNHDIEGCESRNPFWTITSGDLAWRVIGNVFDNPELVANHD